MTRVSSKSFGLLPIVSVDRQTRAYRKRIKNRLYTLGISLFLDSPHRRQPHWSAPLHPTLLYLNLRVTRPPFMGVGHCALLET